MKNRIKRIQAEIDKRQFTVIQRILLIILFCSITCLAGAYIFSLLGFTYFSISDIPLIQNSAISDCIEIMLFFVNMFFLFSISLECFTKNILYYLLGYLPVYFVVENYFSRTLYASFVFPAAYIVLIAIFRRSIIKTAFNLVIFSFLISIYQYLAIQIRIAFFDFGFNDVTSMQSLVFAIDQVLIYAVIYFLVGGEFNEKDSRKIHIKFSIPVKNIEKPYLDNEDSQALEKFHNLEGWDFAKAIVIFFAFQLFQLSAILIISKIGNVLIECIIIIISFVFSTTVIKRRFHTDPIQCTIVSVVLFYVASKISVSAKYSLVISIIIGILISYSLYALTIFLEDHNKYKLFYDKHTSFNLKSCSVEELTERCKVAGLSQDDTELCVRLFVTDIKDIKRVAFDYSIEESSMRKKKSRFAYRLNNIE